MPQVSARTHVVAAITILDTEATSNSWPVPSDLDCLEIQTPATMDATSYVTLEVSPDGGTTWLRFNDDAGALVSSPVQSTTLPELFTMLADGVNGYTRGQWNNIDGVTWLIRIRNADAAGDDEVVGADRVFVAYEKV